LEYLNGLGKPARKQPDSAGDIRARHFRLPSLVVGAV